MSYSIVVVTWQSESTLVNLVDSMNESLDTAPELVVVDNGSTDHPESAARRWRGPVHFTRLPQNRGFGGANNLGVKQASGEAVVLLNPDTELVDGSLSNLASEAIKLQGLVGPRVLNRDRSWQPSASGPSVGVWPWIAAVAPGSLSPPWVLARTEPWRLSRRTRVAWLTGACIAAPRSVLRRLGPFDPNIHLYSEDLDLGVRADRQGIHSYFCPETCRVIHDGKASTSILYDDYGRGLAAANQRAVLRRTFGRRAEASSWYAERLRLSARVLAKGLVGRDNEWDKLVLNATTGARNVPELDGGD